MEKTGDVAGGWEVTWKGLVMWEAMEASGPKMGETREQAGPEEMSRPLSLSAGLCPAGTARRLRKILPSGSAGREGSASPSSLPALSEHIP